MSSKKHITLAAILIIDLLLATILFVEIRRTINLAEMNAESTIRIGELESRQADFSGFRSVNSGLNGKLTILKSFLVAADEKVAVIDQLEELADLAGIKYVLNSAVDSEQISLDAGVTGSFRNIYYFLKLVENAGYWVSFEKMAMSRSAIEGGVWTGNILISIPGETLK